MKSRRQKSGDRRKKKTRIESWLAEVESRPGFRRMMRQSDEDVKEGRVLTQDQVKNILLKSEGISNEPPTKT